MVTRNSITAGVGLRHVRVALRSSTGTPLVPAGTAAGTAYAGIQLSGATRLTVTPPDYRRVNAEGDDTVFNTFVLPPNEKPTGELVTTQLPMEAIALLSSTKMYGSNPVRKLGVATDQVGYEDAVMLWAVRRAIDAESGTYLGQQVWQMYLFLNAIMQFKPPTFENAQVGEATYAIVGNDSSVDEGGAAFTAGVNGFTKAPLIISTWKDFPWLDCFLGDGAETEHTLTHGATGSISTTDKKFVWVNSVLLADDEYAIDGDGVMTLDTPAGDGKYVVVEYSYTP
ncbi:MAG: hypothetical protein PHV11_07455 [Candidatus Bipolaricaulis sp.]|nr:hypothetical protein [Candidatus Bipolaricaulis sp.]